MYKLYVIPGSHACRAAILMLEHKQVPYRRVNFVTLTHPVMARLHGFDAGGQRRAAGAKPTFGLRIGDRLGTVPALAAAPADLDQPRHRALSRRAPPRATPVPLRS